MTVGAFCKLWLTIIFSFFLAAFLTLLPLPYWLLWANPEWLLLVFIGWIALAPNHVGFGFAWLTGLFIDGLMGTLLGLHALILVVMAYIIRDWLPQFAIYSIPRQTLWVIIFVLIYRGLIYWLQGSLGHTANTWFYWFSAFTSALVWPAIFYILSKSTRTYLLPFQPNDPTIPKGFEDVGRRRAARRRSV